MKKIGIIGGGISGLSIARMLSKRYNVCVFESASRVGGLIKCDRINGSLFHRIGGHVFNSKRQDVLDWFWGQFDRETEFVKAKRNAFVSMDNGKMIPYPIENHVYYLDENTQKSFIEDLLDITRKENVPINFEDFLIQRFGKTLYNLYFKPYNYKVWRRDLKGVPLSWLEGKLPMPTVQEMIFNNINHLEERELVHSSFYYAKHGGSQFIADRLSKGLTIKCNSHIEFIKKNDLGWLIGEEQFDSIIYCGNIKQLPSLLKNQIDITSYTDQIEGLESHGTTTVFCEIEKNPYSWVYMPSQNYNSHRIICTGNFAFSNNAEGKLTGTVEFTDEISKDNILQNLLLIPFNPIYLTHHYEKYTYPIQNNTTREMIGDLKQQLQNRGLYLLGRFAEWEYYNMDAAIGAAIDLNKNINL